MGRAKIAMEFIGKEKARHTTYQKRKKGLIKKAHEFSILCNVPVCVIIYYPYKEGNHPLEPEVHSFLGDGPTTLDLARSRDPKVAMEIINRYLNIPKNESTKRALNLYDMFDEWKRRADQELGKLRHKNALAKYPMSDSFLEGFSVDQLLELLVHLDQKVELVRQQIAVVNGGLVPLMDPTTPTMNDSNCNDNSNCNDGYFVDHNQVQYQHQFNHQFAMFNQLVPYDPSGFACPTDADHQGSGMGNLVMYDMNMMGMVSPVCYDQGSGIVDDKAIASSYNSGLPLQLPMFSNVSLPKWLQ